MLRPLAAATGLRSTTVFGGVSQRPQVTALSRGVDIVVACPGRLEDLIQQRHCSLRAVEITVLDEADHMADLGFLPSVRRLLTATPPTGQRMLFSATLDRAVDALVRQFLSDPAVHQADSAQSPVGTMTHHVLKIRRESRLDVLVELTGRSERTVVFTRTKHGAKALARQLNREGVPAVELHGNLAQNARTRNLEDFHGGKAAALVATDIAARGIHVDDVTLVIHADPPADEKAYLHRSGRTARAGNAGTVVTLVTSEQERDVQRMTRAAGIKATVSRVDTVSDPALTSIAPGPRIARQRLPEVHTPAPPTPCAAAPDRSGRRRGRSGSGSARVRVPRAGIGSPPGRSAPAVRYSTSSTHSASSFSSGRR